MDFDHRNPYTKVVAVSQTVVKSWPIARIQAEMDKCDLVCANCHRIRTSRQQTRGFRTLAVGTDMALTKL